MRAPEPSPTGADLEPGDVGMYDPDLADRHGPWVRRLVGRYFRTEIEGLDSIPDGPFLSAGNHNGGVMMPDLVVWMAAYHGLGRAPPLLVASHDLVFSLPPARVARTLSRLGAIRATRDNALAALAAGNAVHTYPGGDHDATKPFRDRHTIRFAGRTGYARTALRAGVPIVPVVSCGAHETLFIFTDGSRWARALGLDRRARMPVLPLMWVVPWGLWLGIPPGFVPLPAQISLRVLPPIATAIEPGEDEDVAVARIDEAIRSAMQRALSEMARGRIPILGKRRRR